MGCKRRMINYYASRAKGGAGLIITEITRIDDKLILIGDSLKPGQIYDALHSAHDRAFVYGK